MIHIERNWRLLWAGKMIVRFPGPRVVGLEWGPPIIWKPRFARRETPSGWGGFDLGFGWWLLQYARPIKGAD